MKHVQLFIDGIWRDAQAGETIDVLDPATEERIGTVECLDFSSGWRLHKKETSDHSLTVIGHKRSGHYDSHAKTAGV